MQLSMSKIFQMRNTFKTTKHSETIIDAVQKTQRNHKYRSDLVDKMGNL